MKKKKAARQPGKKAKRQGKAAIQPSGLTPSEKRKAELQELRDMPGMNLSRLYVGVVRQSHEVKNPDGTPTYPNQVALLDDLGVTALKGIRDQGDPVKLSHAVLKHMRACQAAERDVIQRYACQTALGAAAMQVDGVNQLSRLRQELRSEKKTKRTIETITEEELAL